MNAYAIRWREANKRGQITVKEKEFATRTEMDRFMSKLDKRDGFIEMVAWSAPKGDEQ